MHGRAKGGSGAGAAEKKERRTAKAKPAKGGDEADDDHVETPAVVGFEDRLDDIIGNFRIKSAPKRLIALDKFVTEAQTNVLAGVLESRESTVTDNLIFNLKSPGKELQTSCHALSLLALTLGGSSTLYSQLWPVLQPLFSDPSKTPLDRIATMRTTGVMCMVIRSTNHDSQAAMAALQDIFTKEKPAPAPEILAQALESWGLIASTLPPAVMIQRHKAPLLAVFVDFLENKSLEVRSAAGENIALLLEAEQAPEEEEEEEEEVRAPRAKALPADVDSDEEEARREAREQRRKELREKQEAEEEEKERVRKEKEEKKRVDDAKKAAEAPKVEAKAEVKEVAAEVKEVKSDEVADAKVPSKKSGAPGSAGGRATEKKKGHKLVDMKVLRAKLEELSTDGSHRKSKRDKAKQHSVFRDVLDTATTREQPEETLKVDKSKFEFIGWGARMQLATVRECLAEGLQQHLRDNTLLHSLFDLSPASGDGDLRHTKKDQLASHHAAQTARLHDRAKSRGNKAAIRDGALNHDD